MIAWWNYIEKLNQRHHLYLFRLDDTYILKMKQQFQDQFKVFAYYSDGKIVSFQTALFVNDHMEAHVVGFDNEQENTKSLYNKMLFDYVNEAIVNKCDFISFGRTALEIKSTIGAEPVELFLYLKSHKPIINRVMGSFLSIGKTNEWQQRSPFKKQETIATA